jgi:hypothetical protein
MVLLKQGAQGERRPERPVRHDWHCLITGGIDLPLQDGRAEIAFVALLAALPARVPSAPSGRDARRLQSAASQVRDTNPVHPCEQ